MRAEQCSNDNSMRMAYLKPRVSGIFWDAGFSRWNTSGDFEGGFVRVWLVTKFCEYSVRR